MRFCVSRFLCISLLLFLRRRELRRAVLGAAQDVPIHTMQRGTAISFTTRPRTLVVNQFNSSEENVLVHSLQDGGTYELYCLNESDISPKVGLGLSATFLSRNRFVVLDRTQHLAIKNFKNETVKRLRSPYQKPDFLFPCSVSGRILVRSDDSLCLFETQSRRMLHEVRCCSFRLGLRRTQSCPPHLVQCLVFLCVAR